MGQCRVVCIFKYALQFISHHFFPLKINVTLFVSNSLKQIRQSCSHYLMFYSLFFVLYILEFKALESILDYMKSAFKRHSASACSAPERSGHQQRESPGKQTNRLLLLLLLPAVG